MRFDILERSIKMALFWSHNFPAQSPITWPFSYRLSRAVPEYNRL